MKMRKSEHFVRSSSSIAGQVFSVKMTDKLFETLFSSLYRFKEAAALRETLCNAIDSHNMRNRMHRRLPTHYQSLTPSPQAYSKYLCPTNHPVVVHLPDDFEPWLEIIDYGVGLSLEQIVGEAIPAKEDEVLLEGNMVVKEDEIPESAAVIGVPGFYGDRLVFRSENNEIIRSPGLYTTLFNSTKEDDDGQIGAFGLGSKSPFAVSDSFTVESRYEGKLYRFLMYLNENRMPTVDLVTKDLDTRDPTPEDTDEYNGLTIRVPVKNARFRSFSEELMRLGRVMRPEMRPTVVNQDYNFEWTDINFDNRVGKTFIQPKSHSEKHYAVMGGVSYPVDLTQIDPDLSVVIEKFPTSYTFFDLGELNVPPSREDLSYDEYTRSSLNNAFRYVVKNVMDAKMGELHRAQNLGPMALYIKKNELSELFGSGFRKMVEKEFPADNRFHKGEFRGKGIPEVDRDFDQVAPFRHVSRPYDMEVYSKEDGSSSSSSALFINQVTRWVEKGSSIAIIIDNSARARNLKIQTARNNHDVVIVVHPAHECVTQRNLTDKALAFKNKDELMEYYRSWVGTGDTIDNLVFADKFVESISIMFDPTVVYFMHEMEYERPTVDKDPGMFAFGGEHFSFDSWRELKGPTVSEIIDSGKKIVYIEASGRDCIHQVQGKTLSQRAAVALRTAMGSTYLESDAATGAGENLFEYLGLHKQVVLARRKSVPMMKKFPEVFVPIDAIFDILKEHNKLAINHHNAKQFVMVHENMKVRGHRIRYGASLLEKAFGEVSDRYKTLMNRFYAIQDNMANSITSDEMAFLKRVPAPARASRESRNFVLFSSVLQEMGIDVNLDERELKFYRGHSQAGVVFEEISGHLEGMGFQRMSDRNTISAAKRRQNRLNIESHLIVKFLQENYKLQSENAIEADGRFLAAISKRILRA